MPYRTEQTDSPHPHTMARLAQILKGNGIPVEEYHEGQRGAPLCTILPGDDETLGHRVAKTARQHDYAPELISRSWHTNPYAPARGPYWKVTFVGPTRRESRYRRSHLTALTPDNYCIPS